MNRASNKNTTEQESTTFQIMYYNVLIRELIKEFKQIKDLGKVVQINIMYSKMSTTFVFIRRLKINGTLEARYVFPLNTPDLMDNNWNIFSRLLIG